MSEIVSIDEKIKKIKSQLASLENKKKEMIAKEQLKLSQALSDLIKTNNDFLKDITTILEKHKASEILELIKKLSD